MKKLMVAIALLVFATSIPATAEIIGGTVTGGTALVAGGTFVKLSVPLSNPFGPPNSVGYFWKIAFGIMAWMPFVPSTT
jgi:hypothetical protein